MKAQKNKYQKTLLTLSSLALLPTLAFAGNYAYADSARYQTEVTPSLRLTIPTDSINITVDPSSKPFDSKDLNIIVATNNLTGYNLTMSSDSENLIKTNDDSKTIPTLTTNEGGYTSSTFEANKWGYKIGDGNYIPFVSGTTIGGSDTTTNNDTTTLNFAAKVDYVQPAGEYKTVLNFLAVANPLPVLYAQDLDFTHCPTTPLTVVDNRDNEEYIVQRLADGNCWMLDNLRLDPTEVSLETLKGNTNATDESLTYLKNGGGTGRYPANAVTAGTTWNSDWYNPTIWAGYKDTVIEDTPGFGSKKIGVHYNYCAVSAGSYCYNNHDDTDDADQDICPAGWRLPTGNTSGEYAALYNTLSQDATAFRTKLSLPAGGSSGDTSRVSGYWTSTYSGNGYMYDVELVYFWEDKSRGNGFPIRCILNADLNSIEYLQDVTSGVLNNTAVGTIATLKDRRDEEEYVVGKLADGNLWMLDNLRLDPTEVSLETLKGNTNATDESLTYLKNGGGTDQYPTTSIIASENALTEITESIPQIITGYKDTVAETYYGSSSGKIGVYYNYCAVSAGSYCYPSGEGTGNAQQDICPSNWRLPTGNYQYNGDADYTGNEFFNLSQAYPDESTAATAFGIVIADGYWSANYVPTYRSSGYYWSSTVETPSSMRYASMSDNGITPAGGTSRGRAFSARCIFNK